MRLLFTAVAFLAALPPAAPAQAASPPRTTTAVQPVTATPGASSKSPGPGKAIAKRPPYRPPHRHFRHRAHLLPVPEQRVRDANRLATAEPVSHGFVNAIQVYPYSDGVLYRLLAAPERVTDIALQPGEAIVSVAAGDTVRWTVGDTTSGAGENKQVHILVKPFTAGLATNLILTTDRRTYHLQMDSTGATAMAALSWTYPADALIVIKRQQAVADAQAPAEHSLAVDNLDFAYAISGDNPSWRPLRTFDDGRQTFIEFPASIAVGEAPPLFVLDDKGDAELVNYRMSGHFYVVDRLFTQAELRLGAKKQTIVRITRTGEGKHRHNQGRGA